MADGAAEHGKAPDWVATDANRSVDHRLVEAAGSSHRGPEARGRWVEAGEVATAHQTSFAAGDGGCKPCTAAGLDVEPGGRQGRGAEGCSEAGRTAPGETLMVREPLGCYTYLPGNRRMPNRDPERSRCFGLQQASRMPAWTILGDYHTCFVVAVPPDAVPACKADRPVGEVG